MNSKKQLPLSARWSALVAFVSALTLTVPSYAQSSGHDISAGNLIVVHNDSGDTTNSVTVSMEYSVNDMRVRIGSNRGDYNVQIGDDPTANPTNGVLMSSVRQNGRDVTNTGNKTNCVSMIDSNTNGYWIPVNGAIGLGAGSNPEANINVAGAYFPYATWLGGVANNTANGGALTVFVGSPQLTLGTHFIDNGSGRSTVDLTGLGIDSRTNGILLVSGAKNESANYALSQPNTTNGTWNLFIKDAGSGTASSFEQDPIAFVFVPRTNTSIISGRFLGNGTIDMYSGNSPQFTVTNFATGKYLLKIPGRAPTNGVLIISAEGGGTINQDNIVSYELNAAKDGWEIFSRDVPGTTNAPVPLETPGPTEGVVSFVYIPARGVILSNTNGLTTTEGGGTASFTVALETKPTNTVTIAISSSNTAEGTVSPDTLTFDSSNWNVPQTVTATGVDDGVTDGPVPYTIILAPVGGNDLNYVGYDPADVTIFNTDNEGGIAVVPSSGLTTTESSGTATFTMRLNTQPSADVTIGLSSSNPLEGTVSVPSVTFTSSNWDQEQTVTITGVDDSVDDGNIAYTIITAPATSSDPGYNNVNADDVSVVNIDNDTAAVILSTTNIAVIEGSSSNYTVVLASKPTANVTVNVSSTDTVQGGNVSPSVLTFTPSDWNTPKPVNVAAANDTLVDGNTVYYITNTISSSDPLYAALPRQTVTAVTLDNEAVLTLPSTGVYYGIGDIAVGIDGRASIVDTNSGTYNGTTLTIAITNNAASDDRLEIRNTGTAPGQIGVSGNTVTYSGVSIGTFSGGSGTTPLVITFNNAASPISAEALLRSVTFRNTNSSPAVNYRSISATLVDADGGISSASTKVRVSLIRATEFQEGADHGYGVYSGEADCHLREAAPNTPYPTGRGTDLFVDFPSVGSHNGYHTLMRFDNLFGTGPGQIPTNAIIVSADLHLNFTDSGGGTPMYRMIKAWDPLNETWDSMGSGIDPDDVDARSTYDSQIAVAGGGTTGIMRGDISVLPDIVAWQQGEQNNGWGMTGFSGKTDGTGFSHGESANIDDRPRLRVTWIPAGTASVSFRYGVNGYTNEFDTLIRASAGDTNFAATVTMFSDWSATTNGDNDQLLFRFDNIVGSATNQIPAGATIHAAMFDVANVGGQAMGDGGQFFALYQPWVDTTTTWNSWTNGIQNDGIEAALTATVVAGNTNLDPNVQGGYHCFEVTPDVQAWVNGTRPNYGWAILPWVNGGDGWGINTAESPTERDRPQLRVYYTVNTNFVAPIVIGSITRGASSVTIQFTGAPNTTYSVHRTTALGTSWTPIGPATAAGNGAATFTDNAPPSTAAFYRISSQ